MLMTSTPKKFSTAAIRMAARGPMLRVDMQVAMALGASVQPLTRTTPSVSTQVTARRELPESRERKPDRSIPMNTLHSSCAGLDFTAADHLL